MESRAPIAYTPEQDAKIKSMWERGYSIKQIHEVIGNFASRQSIARRARKLTNGMPSSHIQHKRRYIRSPYISPAPVIESSDKPVPFSVIMDNRRLCKFGVSPLSTPSDQMLFCGKRRFDTKPYCADHCRVAYQGRYTAQECITR